MRNSTAYFAGVATVFTATALGFGGAMMLTSATPPKNEPAKLERNAASSAQASRLADTRAAQSVNSSGTAQDSSSAATPSPAVPAAEHPSQQAATSPPSKQASPSAQAQTETAAQPTHSSAEPSAATSQAKSTANAYARGSDDDVRKYIHKRERHWARRHYRERDATIDAQNVKSDGQNTQSQSAVTANQPAMQDQAQPAQSKATDQASTKVDDSDSGKAKRKRDRRWARGYSRESDDRVRDQDRDQSLEVREMPREDAQQSLFGTPRWRPFFSNIDDDD